MRRLVVSLLIIAMFLSMAGVALAGTTVSKVYYHKYNSAGEPIGFTSGTGYLGEGPITHYVFQTVYAVESADGSSVSVLVVAWEKYAVDSQGFIVYPAVQTSYATQEEIDDFFEANCPDMPQA